MTEVLLIRSVSDNGTIVLARNVESTHIGFGVMVCVTVCVSVFVMVEDASGVVTTVSEVAVEVMDKVIVGVAAVTLVVWDAVFVKVVGTKLSTIFKHVTAAGQLGGGSEPLAGQTGPNRDFLDAALARAFGLRDRLFFLAELKLKVSTTGKNPAGVGTVVVPEALVVVVLVAIEVLITVCVGNVYVSVSILVEVAVKTSVD